MAEEVFKDIRVLKGIPVDQFMGTMGIFSSALGKNCSECHGLESGGNWALYARDTPLKQTARRMVLMVKQINDANFGGRQMVTCYSCHRIQSRRESRRAWSRCIRLRQTNPTTSSLPRGTLRRPIRSSTST
jgi:hypothetical protein